MDILENIGQYLMYKISYSNQLYTIWKKMKNIHFQYTLIVL